MERFYLGERPDVKKEKNNKNKLEIFGIIIVVAFFAFLFLKNVITKDIKSDVEQYYLRIEKVQDKLTPKDASCILEYIEDYNKLSKEEFFDKTYIFLSIKMYDDYTYLLTKKNVENDSESFYFENGKMDVTKYLELISLMNEYSNPGLEMKEEFRNIEIITPARCLFRNSNNMFLNENITEEDEVFNSVYSIINDEKTFKKSTSKVVRYK